ncbi:MAG TPA: glycoside hydrolase family 172 protein, partial [Tianweitania sediminis]|nr:glycoside hydrolase family 172 protein [Tianweitania sediminis]
MNTTFNGLDLNLGNLYRLSDARTRSISPENFTGEKGRGGMANEGTGAECARGLGQGWKVSPSIRIEAGEMRVLADIEGPGAIQQIWLTTANLRWRDLILRIYWDDQEHPSVEAPVGDFFCSGWNRFAQVTSLAVCVNPGRAFNCYWQMPFRKRARITIENRDPEDFGIIYYQINYALAEVPEDAAYFHAQFRRTNP